MQIMRNLHYFTFHAMMLKEIIASNTIIFYGYKYFNYFVKISESKNEKSEGKNQQRVKFFQLVSWTLQF